MKAIYFSVAPRINSLTSLSLLTNCCTHLPSELHNSSSQPHTTHRTAKLAHEYLPNSFLYNYQLSL